MTEFDFVMSTRRLRDLLSEADLRLEDDAIFRMYLDPDTETARLDLMAMQRRAPRPVEAVEPGQYL